MAEILDRQDILERLQDLNVWKRGDQRAPHKPLLVLLGLAKIAQGDERLIPYDEIDEKLRKMLEEFGPPRKAHHPEYPFWRLQNDGIWEVTKKDQLRRRASNTDPLKSELLEKDVRGGFTEPVYETFKEDPLFLRDAAELQLEGHFPESMHDDILDYLGLSLEITRRRSRDPNFRHEVIRAYEHRCAVCGFDLRVGDQDLALEAAHIKWHQAGGPDVVTNGLALCSLHHKALDRGALGLDEERRVMLSMELHGQGRLSQWFLEFVGKPIRAPQAEELVPEERYLRWHRKEVFRSPARETARG